MVVIAQIVTLLCLIACFAAVLLITPRLWGAKESRQSRTAETEEPATPVKRKRRAA